MTHSIMKTEQTLTPDTGSFRDPSGQVYVHDRKVLRGLNAEAARSLNQLILLDFFQQAVQDGNVIATRISPTPPLRMESSFGTMPWSAYLTHELVPFVTYPYEWTFGMLRDAASLQLKLLEDCLENEWTLKDATPFNIQFIGAKPVFIDIGSFEPWVSGEPWVGYRQFCSMFLIPLMLKAYLGVDHTRILRSNLEGVSAVDASKLLKGLARFRRGVISHVTFPALVEMSISRRERDNVPAKRRAQNKQSKAMVVGLVQSLARLIASFESSIRHTDWSEYDKTHTYAEPDLDAKKKFVEQHVRSKKRGSIWDIGCNTGTFSQICSPYASQVIAIDGDHDAVEKLYIRESKKRHSNILPIVMDLANMSPGQGWSGQERKSFTDRGTPDLIICLALIHHLRISANIPIKKYLDWLASLKCDVLIEFVDRHDEMVVKLLTNKREQYTDYCRHEFERVVMELFLIRDQKEIKQGSRVLYMLSPLARH